MTKAAPHPWAGKRPPPKKPKRSRAQRYPGRIPWRRPRRVRTADMGGAR